MRDIERGVIAQFQMSGPGGQPQKAVAGGRIDKKLLLQVLAQFEAFIHHRLVAGVGGMQVEDEIAAGLRDLVVEFDRKF